MATLKELTPLIQAEWQQICKIQEIVMGLPR